MNLSLTPIKEAWGNNIKMQIKSNNKYNDSKIQEKILKQSKMEVVEESHIPTGDDLSNKHSYIKQNKSESVSEPIIIRIENEKLKQKLKPYTEEHIQEMTEELLMDQFEEEREEEREEEKKTKIEGYSNRKKSEISLFELLLIIVIIADIILRINAS